jgi:hypothetical protein
MSKMNGGEFGIALMESLDACRLNLVIASREDAKRRPGHLLFREALAPKWKYYSPKKGFQSLAAWTSCFMEKKSFRDRLPRLWSVLIFARFTKNELDWTLSQAAVG